MTINLTVNGNTYAYPEPGDSNWGTAATDWANAITNGTLQKGGGTFTLLGDVNFGPTFGLISNYFTTTSSNPAVGGDFRLANADTINWRNAANSADLTLTVNSSNQLAFSGTMNLGNAVVTNVTVSGTTTLSALNSAGVVTTNSSGVLATNTTLPAGQFPALTGDVVSAGGTYATTFRHGAANTLLGNPTSGSASFEDVTLGSTLIFSGTMLETAALSGDITSSSNSFVATIANNAVTVGKFQTISGLSVLGNATASTGNVAAITGTAGQVLQINGAGTALAFASVTGTGTVTSVATDSTLTGGPITTTGTLGLNVANANTWTAIQTFNGVSAEETVFSNGNSGTSKTIVWDNGNLQSVTLTGNCTFTFTAPTNPGKFMLILKEDATGGRTITFPTIKYPSGSTPTWTTTANAINILSVMYDGTTYYGVGNVGFA